MSPSIVGARESQNCQHNLGQHSARCIGHRALPVDKDEDHFERSSLITKRVAIPISIGEDSRDSLNLWILELATAPEDSRDTYGSRLWPAAVFLARRLALNPDLVRGCAVLELGSGNGLCSLAAALLGAERVLATDYRSLPLELVRRAADAQLQTATPHQLHTAVFDFAAPLPSVLVVSRRTRAKDIRPPDELLPKHDVLMAADVGYTKALAWRLGERCRESLKRGGRILISDSRKMPECRLAFSEALNFGRDPDLAPLKLTPHDSMSVAARLTEGNPTIWFLDATRADWDQASKQ